MADQRKRLSELPSSSDLEELYTLGVDDENEGVKIPIGGIMKNATDKAQTAVTTANAASTTANQAKTTATNADSKASQAKTTAEAASTLASTAKTTADTAKSMAENAQGNANAAVTTANAALDKAEQALDLATNSNDTAEAVQQYIMPRMFINAQYLLNLTGATTLETVIGKLSEHKDKAMFNSAGAVITFIGESGWESWQYTFYLKPGYMQPTFDPFERANYWRKFGGSATVGNTYNVTVDEPKTGFYDLASAVAVAYEKGFNNIGLQITFAIADKSWKTYQFIGSDNLEPTFKNENNWIDLAGMSAGAETLINIDALCGTCTVAEFYTLEYALAALNKLETETGISYRKVGLIITYRTGQDSFETMQFKEDLGNFGEPGCWKPFGGGGSVETTDTPSNTETDGKKAFSAKGAYEHIPTDFVFDTDTEGVVKARLINAGGETIGNEHQFAVGTGTGGQAGAILEITPKVSPLNGQAGGSIILEAAITLKLGTEFESGIVEKVELYDRDTKQLLETFNKNQATSADKDSFDFTFDLSAYFTSASQRKFQLIAYDDSDRTGSRNVNVNAVDVTIEATQTLNYTASTVLNVGGTQKSLPMYRFANNASEKGIKVITEILINGQWKEVGTATVNDSYSKSISINPNNCAGVALQHGGYLLRIHGEDIASGIVGNYMFTTIMVVDPSNTRPILASRWYATTLESPVKKYETISIEFAAYALNANSLTVQVVETIGTERTVKQSTAATRSLTYRYIQRVQDVEQGETIALTIEAASNTTQPATFKVSGSLIDIEAVSSQVMFDINLENRSNSNADKTITENGYTLAISGSNYSTNGFVKDSFGTNEYTPNDPDNAPGTMALRIAENVKGSLNYPLFNTASIETNGAAIQFRIRTKNIADDDARLISCIQNGIGFYVTGRRVVFTTDNEATVPKTINSALFNDTITDVAIVIKPTSQSPYGGIGVVEMYFDGELIGTCYYDAGTLSRHNAPITFDGTHGDLYLYNIRAWETFYTFEQSFDNYLLKLNDTDAMITEFNFNKVMASQAAEGNPARNIPQMSMLLERGIPCLVMCKSKNTEDVADNYPDYLEGLDGDKKTSRLLDWYYYFPGEEWRNIIVEDMPTTNQGTTSSMRPIKNKKGKTKKAGRVRMMYDRDYVLANYPEHIAEYDELAALCEKNKIQIVPGTFPTNVFCVKVDYSESGGANNGASTNMYNDLTRALGANYMTPSQVFYTGNYELNPCISSIPCALFRTDTHSPDATLPTHAYFHAKGNYNHDKGDATVFGFEAIPGYNDGCLNYGDFYELIAAKGQTLDQYIATADKSTWEYDVDPEEPKKGKWNVIVISEYCGENRRVFRRADNNSEWQETTGTITYNGGRWRITGDVVNPVENYEIRTYDAMAWFQGVSTPEDMVTPGADGKPKWLTYFESRYPDDDNLNAAYEDGRKVPYRLFKWLQWCEECNQNKTAADGNITLDGKSVAGTPENRLKKFAHELHKVANPYSAICYHVFTDYLACVDQRSKNMMVGFYLETDGTFRMYLNHLYDGDTILGSDNDCGLTIPAELDPNNDPDGYYQGHDSVLFTQLAKSDKIWLSEYSASDSEEVTKSKTTTVAAIAKIMREVEISASRLRPFSPQGIEKYWITDRLEKWPKLVSSYDGIRKYIEASKPNANYFFALHGLSIQRLRDYVKTRFRYRDDFYECGDTFQSAAQMRCTGRNMSITITAAKDGYFGLGVDRANEARDSVYLKAGETATLYSENTNTGSGIMLYLFGADRIGKLDLTNATPKQQGWDISPLTLLTELKLGGASYTPATNIGDELSTLNLGQLPFLEKLDVRNFPLTSINATYCPRLKEILATGSKLQEVKPAETSPLETLTLPSTMTKLQFVNLPNLKYPNGGLTIGGFANVNTLELKGCDNIAPFELLTATLNGGATLTDISLKDIDVVADIALLDKLYNANVKGLNSTADNGCDGITGRWISSNFVDDDEHIKALQRYFKPTDTGLDVHNAQFTAVVFDDTISDPKNITNLDNNTTGDTYEPSGHINRIRKGLVPVFGKLNTATGQFEAELINEANYQKLADGSDFDYRDTSGTARDAFMYCPHLWYKGVNDFKNQKKYIFWSSVDNEPISTATKVVRNKLSELECTPNTAIQTSEVIIGTSTLADDNVFIAAANYNTYRMNVAGMKQARWPGLNHSVIGAAFLNADGVIVGTFNMAISNTMFDFVNGDYVFCDIPEDAVTLVFTSQNTNNDLEAIAVNSNQIEAIEPDWVENEPWLGGIYHASVDSLVQLRSISQATVRCGTGTSKTSDEWTYDSDGRAKNTPVGALNYSYKDFQNLAMRRGNGYQLFDYEMSKLMAILWFSLNGTRDSQLKCGYGRGAGGSTGYADTLGNTDSKRGQISGNKILGFESFVGCTWEVMDNVAVNVLSFESYLKEHGVENSQIDPINAVWHIYDPISKTERTVQGITTSGYCIGRVKHGRYCDVIASKTTSDNSVWASDYTDGQWYSASRCRCVGRSSGNSYAYGGLVFAGAGNASSYSYTYVGSRLAFRGIIVINK